MNTGIMSRIRRFLADTMKELAQCSWPAKNELFESTVLVVVVIMMLAFFVFFVDKLGVYVIQGITTGAW